MKIFGAVFWAIILIVIGIIIILNQTFDWHINIFSIVFGIVLIFIGIAIIMRPSHSGINGMFANGKIKNIKSGENSYIFSSITLNLNDINSNEIEINSVFSNIKLNTAGKSVRIKSSGVFSSTIFPDKTSVSFGDRIYERDGENTIYIETNCVFGSIVIE